jgi:hypothetical protein
MTELEVIQQIDTCNKLASSISFGLAGLNEIEVSAGSGYYRIVAKLNEALAELLEYTVLLYGVLDEEKAN